MFKPQSVIHLVKICRIPNMYFYFLFSSFQLLSHVRLFATPWNAACQPSLSLINSWIYSNSCLWSWWCHPAISSSVIPFSSCLQFSSIRVFSSESVLHTGWPKYWSFSFSITLSNEYSGLISFRMDWLDLLVVQRTLRVFFNTTVQKHQFFSAQLSL